MATNTRARRTGAKNLDAELQKARRKDADSHAETQKPPNNGRIDQKNRRLICKLRKAGYPRKDIAERVGIGLMKLKNILTRENCSLQKKWTDDEKKEILQQADKAKYNIAQIARQFNMCRSTVKRMQRLAELTEEQRKTILDLFHRGYSRAQIVCEVNETADTVAAVIENDRMRSYRERCRQKYQAQRTAVLKLRGEGMSGNIIRQQLKISWFRLKQLETLSQEPTTSSAGPLSNTKNDPALESDDVEEEQVVQTPPASENRLSDAVQGCRRSVRLKNRIHGDGDVEGEQVQTQPASEDSHKNTRLVCRMQLRSKIMRLPDVEGKQVVQKPPASEDSHNNIEQGSRMSVSSKDMRHGDVQGEHVIDTLTASEDSPNITQQGCRRSARLKAMQRGDPGSQRKPACYFGYYNSSSSAHDQRITAKINAQIPGEISEDEDVRKLPKYTSQAIMSSDSEESQTESMEQSSLSSDHEEGLMRISSGGSVVSNSAKLPDQFNSWQMFDESFKEYQKSTFQTFAIDRSKMLDADNPQFSVLQYEFVEYVCVHHKGQKAQGSRDRANSFQYARKTGCSARLTVAARLNDRHLIVTKKNLRHNHPENRPRDPEQTVAVRERVESRAPAVATANQVRTRTGRAVTLIPKPSNNGRVENDERRENVVTEMHEERLSWDCIKKKPKISGPTLEQLLEISNKEAISSDERVLNNACVETVEQQQLDNVEEEQIVHTPPSSQEESDYTVHGCRRSELKALQQVDPGNNNRQDCSLSDRTSAHNDAERISAGIHLPAGYIEEEVVGEGSRSTPQALVDQDIGRNQAVTAVHSHQILSVSTVDIQRPQPYYSEASSAPKRQHNVTDNEPSVESTANTSPALPIPITQTLPIETNWDDSHYLAQQPVVSQLHIQGYSCASAMQHIDVGLQSKHTPLRAVSSDAVERDFHNKESPAIFQLPRAQPSTAIVEDDTCVTPVATLCRLEGVGNIEQRTPEAAVDHITTGPFPTLPEPEGMPSEDRQQSYVTSEKEDSISGQTRTGDADSLPNDNCAVEVHSPHSENGTAGIEEIRSSDDCRAIESQKETTASVCANNRWLSLDDYFGMRYYQQNAMPEDDHVATEVPENISSGTSTEPGEFANTATLMTGVSADNTAPQSQEMANREISQNLEMQSISLKLCQQGSSSEAMKQHLAVCFLSDTASMQDDSRVDEGQDNNYEEANPIDQLSNAQPSTAIRDTESCVTPVFTFSPFEEEDAFDTEQQQSDAVEDSTITDPIVSPRPECMSSEGLQQPYHPSEHISEAGIDVETDTIQFPSSEISVHPTSSTSLSRFREANSEMLLLSPENATTSSVRARYQCHICRLSCEEEDAFLLHLAEKQHAELFATGVFLYCTRCKFKTRKPATMGKHIVKYQSQSTLQTSDIHSVTTFH